MWIFHSGGEYFTIIFSPRGGDIMGVKIISYTGSYLADPTSPIPSHCAVIILFQSVPVHQLSRLAL